MTRAARSRAKPVRAGGNRTPTPVLGRTSSCEALLALPRPGPSWLTLRLWVYRFSPTALPYPTWTFDGGLGKDRTSDQGIMT